MLTKMISELGKFAFMIEDNPRAYELIRSQDVLHAIMPELAKRNKYMPRGATDADFWMLKHGDPLLSFDAAKHLIESNRPDALLGFDTVQKNGVKFFEIRLHTGGREGNLSIESTCPLAAGFCAALLSILDEEFTATKGNKTDEA